MQQQDKVTRDLHLVANSDCRGDKTTRLATENSQPKMINITKYRGNENRNTQMRKTLMTNSFFKASLHPF